jgi:hypothetical protein
LDEPTAAAYGKHYATNDERHHLVMNGMVKIPWGFRLSGLITLGSGQAYDEQNAALGWDYGLQQHYRGQGRPTKYSFIIPDAWNYRSVDLKLQKDFAIGKTRIGVSAEAINIFNYNNFKWYDGTIADSGGPNAHFGQPWGVQPGRRLQFGATFTF